ncbi:MAG: ABC transporter substrate-binding protein [Proteobacteria bacterium]|nr:ABC transporter substrate-binding protein [Pseudomonadota bacterium]MBU1640622.1 ABC transporter substrate-binding protein [Pseudomonadota bacterium]
MRQRSNLVILTIAALLITILLSSSLSSCGREPQHPLLIGTNVWLGYEPLFVARSLKYFTPQEVRLLEFTSNTDSIHAFRHGALDAAALTLDEALLLAQDGIDFKVVLVLDISHGADAIVGQANSKTFPDLKGLKIGVENTAVGAYMLARALEIHDLQAKDVTMVPLEIFEHEKAFTKGTVDAVVTFEPVRSKLLAKGGNILFDSSEIPGEIVDVLIVRSDRLAQNREHLSKLLRGWFSTLDYLQENQADALHRMTPRLALPPAELRAALAGLRFPSLADNLHFLQGGPEGLVNSGTRLSEIMVRSGLLKKQVPIAPLLTTDLLREI